MRAETNGVFNLYKTIVMIIDTPQLVPLGGQIITNKGIIII